MALAALGGASPSLASSVIGRKELAVVVNREDPLSMTVGAYYQRRRGLPAVNLIPVSLPPGGDVLAPADFAALKAELDAATPPGIQAYLLAWNSPYRVGCMSITTAVAAGFDPAFCAKPCGPTRDSPLFLYAGHRPFDDHGWRPAMLLPARDLDDAKALVERGIAADGTFPPGTAYLVSTTDRARNVRAAGYETTARWFRDLLDVRIIHDDAIRRREDVLFYFTGSARVPDLATNRFLPGAIADHLTSAGGQLRGSQQMPVTAWLAAGATASYGAVTEPCNYPRKFPVPGVVMDRYVAGEPVIEAYWKSVRWPGQGLFVGEPLARPFGREIVDGRQ